MLGRRVCPERKMLLRELSQLICDRRSTPSLSTAMRQPTNRSPIFPVFAGELEEALSRQASSDRGWANCPAAERAGLKASLPKDSGGRTLDDWFE